MSAYIQKEMYENVHSSFLFITNNTPQIKLEKTQMFIGTFVVLQHNGLLHSNKKNELLIQNNMDESQRQYIEKEARSRIVYTVIPFILHTVDES